MTDNHIDVLINGCGIGGAMLAYLLGRQGHRVVVVEQARRERAINGADLLKPAGIRVVEAAGLLAEVTRRGGRVRHEPGGLSRRRAVSLFQLFQRRRARLFHPHALRVAAPPGTGKDRRRSDRRDAVRDPHRSGAARRAPRDRPGAPERRPRAASAGGGGSRRYRLLRAPPAARYRCGTPPLPVADAGRHLRPGALRGRAQPPVRGLAGRAGLLLSDRFRPRATGGELPQGGGARS